MVKTASSSAEIRRSLWTLFYPSLDRSPLSAEPEKNFAADHENGKEILLAHAPSRLSFALPSGRYLISGNYGIKQAAYRGAGRTDGVQFRIALTRADAPDHEILRRYLDPRKHEMDRGAQAIWAELSVEAPSVLVFETAAGASDSWDWSYWSDLKIELR